MPEIYEGNTGVYCIRNIRNGKRYVGSAAQGFIERWKNHRSCLSRGVHKNAHLLSAWNKYGADKFVFQILERCLPERCVEREQYWMDYFDVINPKKGYNTCPVAGSVLGMKKTEKQRARQSEIARQMWTDTEHRRKMAETMRLVAADPEVRCRKSEANKRRFAKVEERYKLSKSHKGKVHSTEHARKVSEATRRAWADPERRAKRLESLKRFAENPEWSSRKSEAIRRKLSEPETRRKRLESLKRSAADPEVRRRKSEGIRRYWEKWRAERGK